MWSCLEIFLVAGWEKIFVVGRSGTAHLIIKVASKEIHYSGHLRERERKEMCCMCALAIGSPKLLVNIKFGPAIKKQIYTFSIISLVGLLSINFFIIENL